MDTLTTAGRPHHSVADAHGQPPAAAFSLFNSAPITRADLLRHALNVSRHLPDGRYALNLCQDRYFFIVAFLAVLLKKQRNLLPPNQTPHTAKLLLENYPQSYCITDKPNAVYDRVWLFKPEHFDGKGGGFEDIPETQIAAVSFTSGSTGQPKAIAKTWGEFRHAARLALRQLNLAERDWHIISTVPPQHMYGLETSLFWPLGSSLTIDNRQPFFPEDIRRAITKPCLLVSTPAHLKACVGADFAWKNIKMILSSTGPLTPDLAKEVECKMGAPVFEILGSTETQSYASRRVTINEKWTPYPGIRLTESNGAYRVSGGHLHAGVALDDRFDICADNRFKLVGRSSELVKVAGKRISLAELNQALNSIDGVEDGVFFQGLNDRLGALVVSRLSKQQILDALKPIFDAVFLPRPIYHVERLPRNDLGKIDHTRLQELIDACK